MYNVVVLLLASALLAVVLWVLVGASRRKVLQDICTSLVVGGFGMVVVGYILAKGEPSWWLMLPIATGFILSVMLLLHQPWRS